ncbi:hypothetical protein AHMF7605_11240 [Adhaeribacter arboris]|uniref:Uncharacterized protein n=1 Tax=Adhaeribacter arboris TaxID=2072846 RepID=A0A2T2YEX5_9BACT|nr:hypothetical protein AHMF7605_11240 [Adhaeribacter arboris]
MRLLYFLLLEGRAVKLPYIKADYSWRERPRSCLLSGRPLAGRTDIRLILNYRLKMVFYRPEAGQWSDTSEDARAIVKEGLLEFNGRHFQGGLSRICKTEVIINFCKI